MSKLIGFGKFWLTVLILGDSDAMFAEVQDTTFQGCQLSVSDCKVEIPLSDLATSENSKTEKSISYVVCMKTAELQATW